MNGLNVPGSAAETLAWMEQLHQAWQAGLKELRDLWAARSQRW